MSPAAEFTGTQLTHALRALDINFIMGGQSANETLHKQPARLSPPSREVANPACAYRSFPSFLNILNSLYMSGRRHKSSTLPLALHFNAITLQQSGWVKNINNPDRYQTTFRKNCACTLEMTPKKTCEIWQNVTRN